MSKATLIIICGSSDVIFKRFLSSFLDYNEPKDVDLFLIVPSNKNYSALINASFKSVKEYVYDNKNSVDQYRTQIINSTSSEYIIFLEDHVEIKTELIQSVINNLKNYCALTFAVQHGNPKSWISRITYEVEYSNWRKDRKSSVIKDYLTGHNNAYRKSALLGLGNKLNDYFRSEMLLQKEIMKNGGVLYFTNEIIISHYQFEKMSKVLFSSFWFNWNSADAKQKLEKWSIYKRLLYAVAINVKPIVRLFLYLKSSKQHLMKKILYIPILLLIYFAGSFGETGAYLFGTYKAPYFNNH